MHPLTVAHAFIWVTAAAAMLGVVIRPWGLPRPSGRWRCVAAGGELVAARLAGVDRGSGRSECVFVFGRNDAARGSRAPARSVRLARGAGCARSAGQCATASSYSSMSWVWAVTMLLSNDATAVVLTPAVCAAARAVRAPPLPYVYICAFVANAASFILPISNPANLVVFGNQLPPLGVWLAQFTLPSLVAIVATFIVLRAHAALFAAAGTRGAYRAAAAVGRRTRGGRRHSDHRRVASGSVSKIRLAGAAYLHRGCPDADARSAASAQAPWPLLRSISWMCCCSWRDCSCWWRRSIALACCAVSAPRWWTSRGIHRPLPSGLSALPIALVCNIANNLPVALTAGTVLMSLPFDGARTAGR